MKLSPHQTHIGVMIVEFPYTSTYQPINTSTYKPINIGINMSACVQPDRLYINISNNMRRDKYIDPHVLCHVIQ